MITSLPFIASHRQPATRQDSFKHPASFGQLVTQLSKDRDNFQPNQPQTRTAPAEPHFAGGNFKRLVKDFKKLDGATLEEEKKIARVEDFAGKLYQICASEKELLDFAKQAGIEIHYAPPDSPIGQWLKEESVQGYAIYPKSKIQGLSADVLKDVLNDTKNGNGFERLSECEKNQKPLILILNNFSNRDFKKYVLQHELFHIIQHTVGIHGLSAANYQNEKLASGWHQDLLKTLTNKRTDKAKAIIQTAEQNKLNPVPNEMQNTFGQGLRSIIRLDLQAYQFFCRNASALKMPDWLKKHNEDLLRKYETIQWYSCSPDLNTGLTSIEMRRS